MSTASLIRCAALLVVALSAAILALPASWGKALLPTGWPVSIIVANGTLWQGEALVALGSEGRRRTLSTPLQWHLGWCGTPCLELRHAWLSQPLTLKASWRGLVLPAGSLQMPASTLTAFHAFLDTVQPGGELTLTWPALTLRPDMPADTRLASLRWTHAASGLAPVRPFGDYTLDIRQAASRQTALSLSADPASLLLLQGSGTFSPQRPLQFEGTARINPQAGADLRRAMDALLTTLGPRAEQHTVLRIR